MHEERGETLRHHTGKPREGKIEIEKDGIGVWGTPPQPECRNGAFRVCHHDGCDGGQGDNLDDLSQVRFNEGSNGGYILSDEVLFVLKLHDMGLKHLLFSQRYLPRR